MWTTGANCDGARPPKLFLPARHTSAVVRLSLRAMWRASCRRFMACELHEPIAMALRPLEAVHISSGGERCGQCKQMPCKGGSSLMPRRRQSASCAGQL